VRKRRAKIPYVETSAARSSNHLSSRALSRIPDSAWHSAPRMTEKTVMPLRFASCRHAATMPDAVGCFELPPTAYVDAARASAPPFIIHYRLRGVYLLMICRLPRCVHTPTLRSMRMAPIAIRCPLIFYYFSPSAFSHHRRGALQMRIVAAESPTFTPLTAVRRPDGVRPPLLIFCR